MRRVRRGKSGEAKGSMKRTSKVWKHLRTLECSTCTVLQILTALVGTVTCQKRDLKRQHLAASSAEHLMM